MLQLTVGAELRPQIMRAYGSYQMPEATKQGAELGALQGSFAIVGPMSEVFDGSLHALLVTSVFFGPREFSRPKLSLDLLPDGVYGQFSVARRTRSVPVMQSRYVRIFAAVLGFSISSLCLAACGSSGASTSTTATSSPATKPIVTAWFAAQKAFHDAALTSDANSPELNAAMIPPQLDRARTNLARLLQGDIRRGADILRQPPDASSAIRPGRSAVVHTWRGN